MALILDAVAVLALEIIVLASGCLPVASLLSWAFSPDIEPILGGLGETRTPGLCQEVRTE